MVGRKGKKRGRVGRGDKVGRGGGVWGLGRGIYGGEEGGGW